MTKTEDKNDEVVVAEPEPLQGFLLPSGDTCFIGDRDEVVAQAMAEGYKQFYVLGTLGSKVGTGQVKATHYEPRLFKVTNNLVGVSIDSVDNDDMALTEFKPWAQFNLPPLPIELVNDMDDFFRMVHAKHGTEAIVMLTYDITYRDSEDPSDGWGVLIPKQENTAGHCKYDQASVVDDIPDGKELEIFIVGSAHSHPNMSAFASGIDHDDQADFDGLHITYGWKSGSKTTEYHAEMQMGGSVFTIQAKDIFTEVPKPPKNEKVEPWLDRVSKAAYVPKATTSGGMYSNTSDYYKATGAHQVPKDLHLPTGCPRPSEAGIIVGLISSGEIVCPVCQRKMTDDERDNRRRCSTCLVYICHEYKNETIEEVIEARLEQKMPVDDIDILASPKRPVIFLHRRKVGQALVEEKEILWEGTEVAGKA